MSDRFEFIKDCHGNTVLIDKTHQLPSLPFLAMFDDLTDEDKENIVLQVIDVNTCDTQYCEINWDNYPPTVTIENIQLFGIAAFAQGGLANDAATDSLAEAPTEEAAGAETTTEG